MRASVAVRRVALLVLLVVAALAGPAPAQRVVEGDDPGTWRIEELRGVLTVKRASADEPAISPLCVTLYVRAVAADNPGYQVYREVFFTGEGCVSK